jgi:hypothetical protein
LQEIESVLSYFVYRRPAGRSLLMHFFGLQDPFVFLGERGYAKSYPIGPVLVAAWRDRAFHEECNSASNDHLNIARKPSELHLKRSVFQLQRSRVQIQTMKKASKTIKNTSTIITDKCQIEPMKTSRLKFRISQGTIKARSSWDRWSNHGDVG